MIEIDKKKYFVNNNEFTTLISSNKYCNLQLYNELGTFERIIGLINDILSDCKINNFIQIDVTHGGFIMLNCLLLNTQIYYTCSNEHKSNIDLNIESFFKQTNIKFNLYDKNIINQEFINNLIVYSNNIDSNCDFLNYNPFIISQTLIKLPNYTLYKLTNTDYYIYVHSNQYHNFNNNFKYYIREKEYLDYDNMINLCIMVKNAGENFENMLNANLPFIDKWTILDTGSTDNTIEIINKVLVGKKKGKLYQEQFINFRDSRNRLLELAGDDCKYTLMLDDTYILKGDVKQFFNLIRSDQFADSYSLYIKSNDTEYSSNRIVKTKSKLRYKYTIHEVIQCENNINVIIPIDDVYIFDERFEYMEERTMSRKKLDIELLEKEIEINPDDPRNYYYLAQTYKFINEHEKAFEYFMRRINLNDDGFIQEKIDALFEAARTANFKLNMPWNICEKLYLQAYELDKNRPDSIYFIGINYYLKDNKEKAFEYLKLAYNIGYPIDTQYNLKPTISFYYTPFYLTELCYTYKDYKLGEEVALFFFKNNKPDVNNYAIIMSWYKIFLNINRIPKNPSINFNINVDINKPFLCFVADGGFNKWSGSTILNKGVGGSETYIIEMARYIQQHGYYQVFVFCNCENEENFEGVYYIQLSNYYEFITQYFINTCIISRFSEYYPATELCNVENIYLIAHDLSLSGSIIPITPKLKKIFTLTEWHTKYLSEIFPQLANIITHLYYGINDSFDKKALKIPYKFIYSSFPNRGLFELLEMWPEIYKKQPQASLHIYSDINGKWVNEVEGEKMGKIRNLLNKYIFKENSLNIHYHGWVDKNVLSDAWSTSEFWLYPCTFKETFCLTALEAAISKTIPITNNLAALENTVGDRGIIIEGDASTKEWQMRALKELFNIMDFTSKKNIIIERNYNWSKKLSWKNQANKLLNNYLLQNKLEYRGEYNFSSINDKNMFLNFIKYFNMNLLVDTPKILEIGTYVGTSIIEFANLIPNSNCYAIDEWRENNKSNYEQIFDNNIKISGLNNRIIGLKSRHIDALLKFYKDNIKFHIIYLNKQREIYEICSLCELAFQILENGGFLIIDDYLFIDPSTKTKILEEPINYFLNKYRNKYKIHNIGYRVFLEKNN